MRAEAGAMGRGLKAESGDAGGADHADDAGGADGDMLMTQMMHFAE